MQSELLSALGLPLMVTPDTMVMEAIDRMSGIGAVRPSSPATDRSTELPTQARFSCVSIVADDRLVGILTQGDIVRLIATRQDLANLAIREVMTSNPIALRLADFTDLAMAIDLLDRHQIRHLPVVDDRNCLLGILTAESIQHHLAQTRTAARVAEQPPLSSSSGDILAQPSEDSAAPFQAVETPAELQLRASSRFLHTLIETFPLAIFWKDRESRYLGCNYNFARDANLSLPEQIVGKTDYDLPWGAFEGDAYRETDRQIIASGVAKLGIIETQTRIDGTTIWVEKNKLPLPNLDGETIGILGTYQDITDRQQAELALQESQYLIEQIAQASPNILHLYDLQTQQNVYVNREITRVLGYTPAEIQAMGSSLFQNLIHPDDFILIPAEYVRIAAAQDGDILEFEYRMKRANGEWCWLLSRNSIFRRDLQGRVWQTIGTAQDITDRKLAEETISRQLKQQQALGFITKQIRNSLQVKEILATATEQVKELMMVDRVIVFQIFPDATIGAVAEVVAPEYTRLMGRNWQCGQVNEEEIEFYLQGVPRIVVDVRQDLWSAKFHADLKMAQVESQIVAPILLPAPDGETQLGIDSNGRTQLWGFLCVHACVAQRQWRDTEAQLLMQIADQLAIAIQQASLFEQLQAELTERQQAEAQLRQSNQELARATRLKDEFLSSMSHELRTPLNAILGMSEALQTMNFGSLTDRQHQSIATIANSGKHLLALINGILDFSQMTTDRVTLELTDVSIQALCQDSMLFVQELARKRRIRLKLQLPDYLQPLNLRVDDRRFRQVPIELLSNAIKFTPDGGSVVLDVRVVEGSGGVGEWGSGGVGVLGSGLNTSIDRQFSVRSPWQIALSVVDTGIGIAAENMDKLFQTFVQIDGSLNRQYAGTGLGLASVDRIVEMHGGTISVQSEINRGSCFTVLLPFDPGVDIVLPSSLSPLVYPLTIDIEDPPTIEPKASILIVEANPAHRETMTSYLKSRGYHPIEAKNGQQAIDLAQSHHPDIILMDMQMPVMDGFETTRQIRQLPECAAIPIIALTTLSIPLLECQQKCLQAGIDRQVTKPVKFGQLVSTIESLLHDN